MAEKAKAVHQIRDFPGIQLSAGPSNLQPGEALDQVNVRSDQAARLNVRRGVKTVSFEQLVGTN